MSAPPPFHIAIVGGGITGLALAIGLHTRHIPFTVYERIAAHTTIDQLAGAGLGLSPNAERALHLLAPQAHAAYDAVANPNGEDCFQWVDGLTRAPLFRLATGKGAFRGCQRAALVEAFLRCLPRESVRFGKRLVDLGRSDDGDKCSSRVLLKFADGEVASADAVIGCDGINSRLRALVYPNLPNTAATYTQKYSFRALVPMADARAALGQQMVATRYMYNGPGAHIVTYPVANDTLLNTLAVISDPQGTGQGTGLRATRSEAQCAFEEWHPEVRRIVDLLPDEMDKWPIFDVLVAGERRFHLPGSQICLAGDAAHAVSPHLGAGAGFGIEDACLLAELLAAVQDARAEGGGTEGLSSRLDAAFQVFSDVRYDRTQWLAQESRNAGDLFEWADPEIARNSKRFGEEITWRFHKIWFYDINKMLDDAKAHLSQKLGQM